MDNARFDILNKELPSSLRIKLDRICRYLSQNMASAMVGAGFSLNAKKMNPHAQMKSWNTLVGTFWDLIYADEEKKFDFTTPMHLASLLEASHGRSELDHQIASSLPDDELLPGDLHLAMMRLPWKDVFTTNYDRLLERAADMTDRSYNVVTNKNSLLYKTAPRIIKLHGSFPDISPFIMTEDDFRTYPQKYPEFVNTVRQALIENVFCLIGFSGEDPNFLSWLGWLRDIMGNLASPVYLITYNEKLNEADVKLNYKRGIDYVNMADIPEVKGINEGLTFFFEYLERSLKPKKEWRGDLPYRAMDTKPLKEILPLMKEIRETYPGWIYLPEIYYDQFQDIEESFPYLGEKAEMLDEKDKIDCLYEIDWRLRISACPNHVVWFIEGIKKLKISDWEEKDGLDDKEKKKIIEKIVSLKLSLLTTYRLAVMWDEFETLESELLDYFEKHESDMTGRLCYERCQYYLVKLDFAKVKEIVMQWYVSDVDYQSLFWKANVLNGLGEAEKSVVLLETIRKNVNSALLKDNSNRALLDSCSHLANLILSYYVPKIDVANIELHNNEIDFYHLLGMVKLKSETKPFKVGTYDEHGFLLRDVNTVWSSGDRGFFKDYVNAFRILFLLDQVGFPHQVFGKPVLNNEVQPALKIMVKYDSGMVIATVVKMNGGRWVMRNVYNRELFGYVKREEAKAFYRLWYETCKNAVERHRSEKYLESLLYETVIPTLMYMCVKLDQDQIVNLFKLYIAIYNLSNPEYQSKLLKLLYACMDEQSIKEILPNAFLIPTGKYDRMQDSRMEYPTRGYKGFCLTSEMVRILTEGLKDNNYNRKIETLLRLEAIARHVKDGLKDETLLDAVYELRSQKRNGWIALRTFDIIPYNAEKEGYSLETVVYNLVDKLKIYQLDGTQFSQDLFAIRENLEELQYVASELTRYMPDVTDKVLQFMQKYSDQLCSYENHNEYGQSQYIDYFLTILYRLLTKANLVQVGADKLEALVSEIKKLEKDFDVAGITAVLMMALNVQDTVVISFINGLRIKMYSADRKRRTDALSALKYLASHDHDMNEVVDGIYQYLKTSQDSYVHEYIEFLSYLRNINLLELSNDMLVAMGYLRQRLGDASFSANAKADILYSVSLFLRSIHVRDNQLIKERNEWKKLVADDPEMFNDVKMAFDGVV